MRKLDNWLKSYMQYTSGSESPEKIHFWVGVSTLAGALRRRVWIDMGHFEWTPNFYIVIVAPPGIVTKTTTMNIGMNLLREVKGIKFGPDVITWQALAQSLANATQGVQLKPGEFTSMSCLTIASGEFGNFLNPKDRDMIDVLVSLWDGQKGTWEKSTKTSGSDVIKNPWLNIISCTTPAWIEENFPQYLIGGGFTSRTIWIYSDYKRKLNAYPSLEMDAEVLQLRKDLIHDLTQVSQLAGEMKLTPEAFEYGTQWYEKHHSEENRSKVHNRFAGYLARKQTQMHKLAMVLSAAESPDLYIEKEHLEAADQIITSLEEDMPKIFEGIGSDALSQKTFEVSRIVKRVGKIERTDLYRMLFRVMSYEDFQKAIESCLKAGLIEAYGAGTKIFFTSNES